MYGSHSVTDSIHVRFTQRHRFDSCAVHTASQIHTAIICVTVKVLEQHLQKTKVIFFSPPEMLVTTY